MEVKRPYDQVKKERKKTTFMDKFQGDKIKINKLDCRHWENYYEGGIHSVVLEGLIVSLYICEFSYLLGAKFYTARNKNSF